MKTSALVIENRKEDNVILKKIFCIYYLFSFKKNEIRALINSINKINAISPRYILKLDLKFYHTIRAQKIDGSTFKIFEMVQTSFQVEDKLGQTQYFQKMFLLANTSIKIVLEISFLTFSNTNILFLK